MSERRETLRQQADERRRLRAITPTVGRIVHYQSFGTPRGEYKSEPRAAIVTQVLVESPCYSDIHQAATLCVGLAVLNPTGLFFHEHVEFSEAPSPGRWSWPPRV